MKNIFSLFSVLLLLTGCGSVPPKKPDGLKPGDYSYLKSYMSWLIETEMRKQDVEGLSIAVVDDQQVVWAQGFGFSDAANKIAATPETIYRVGSVSKLFTDTLVMQLAEQGKLDIDKPLQNYLPEFAIKTRFPEAAAITPRNIMTHHSGLPSDIGNGMWNAHPAPFEELASQLKDDYVAYPPNTILSYSNLGLTLLGHTLERVTGTNFSRYAAQRLLQPLGMQDAQFSTGIAGKSSSKSYKSHQEMTEAPLRDMPAGGLNAHVLDMGRFMQMLLAGGESKGRQILKPETVQEMLRPQNKDIALDVGQQVGLGWFLRNSPEFGPVAEHAGATMFHASLLTLSTKHKLGVITLSNSPNSMLQKLNDAALKLALATKTAEKPLEMPESTPSNRALSTQEREALAGSYATALGYVKLTDDGDRMVMELNGKNLDIVGREDGKYGISYRLLGFIPIQPEELAKIGLSLSKVSGHDLVLAHVQGQIVMVGEKIKPTPIPPAWQARLGDYQIVNLSDGDAIVPKNCALRERDGFLVMEYALPALDLDKQTLAISALSDSEAVTLGLGRGMRETLRSVVQDGKPLLAYSGYLLQKK